MIWAGMEIGFYWIWNNHRIHSVTLSQNFQLIYTTDKVAHAFGEMFYFFIFFSIIHEENRIVSYKDWIYAVHEPKAAHITSTLPTTRSDKYMELCLIKNEIEYGRTRLKSDIVNENISHSVRYIFFKFQVLAL